MRVLVTKTKRSIDAIFTLNSQNALCCLAVQHGFGYGINSRYAAVCRYQDKPPHRVLFIDNDYKKYNHQKHLAVVRQFRPRYATVKDVMSLRDLLFILDCAAELSLYAEHVILIPKVDCVDKIPEQYMLGYAVPTSHGSTDLPYDAFGNRPVHLLGGAWQQQRDLLLNSGMNIVSLDFNHCHKLARAGVFNDGKGYEYKIADAMPSFSSRPYFTCMALSLAAIRCELDKLCSSTV